MNLSVGLVELGGSRRLDALDLRLRQQLVDLRGDLAREHGILVQALRARIGREHAGDVQVVEVLLQPQRVRRELRPRGRRQLGELRLVVGDRQRARARTPR